MNARVKPAHDERHQMKRAVLPFAAALAIACALATAPSTAAAPPKQKTITCPFLKKAM
jgi:hypothetical protein